MLPQSKTEIAKMAVQLVISAKTTAFARNQITDRTNMNPDGIPVTLTSQTIGWLVGVQVRPFTDKAVDKTIEKYQAWRTKKKSSTEEK